MLNIDIAASELLEILDKAGSVQPLRAPMERSVERIRAYMAAYPPPRQYRRTYRLKRGWKTQIVESANNIKGTASNAVAYGPFVQSDELQANIHQDFWQTDVQALQENQSDIEADFARTIQAILR